jgi:hypothetical protein
MPFVKRAIFPYRSISLEIRQTLGRRVFLDDQPASHPILNNTNIVPEGAQNWAQFIPPWGSHFSLMHA